MKLIICFLCLFGSLITITNADEESLYPSICGIKFFRNRIIGGIEAENNTWPWIVSLQHNFRHICAGTLLNNQWILTAAHCLEYTSLSSYKIILGSNNNDLMTTDGIRKSISKMIKHADYDINRYYNDIALLKLSTPVDLSPTVFVPCMPSPDEDLKDTYCTAIGWGYTFYNGEAQSILREADVDIVDNETCEKTFGYMDSSRQLCAGHKGTIPNTCKGDSGGGLVCKKADSRWYIEGIVSYGMECRDGGVYTRVSSYLDWIENKIRNN